MAVPNEITGNEVDCSILPALLVNHQFARKLCWNWAPARSRFQRENLRRQLPQSAAEQEKPRRIARIEAAREARLNFDRQEQGHAGDRHLRGHEHDALRGVR